MLKTKPTLDIQQAILEVLRESDRLNPMSLEEIFKLIPKELVKVNSNVSEQIFLKAFWELFEQEAVVMDADRKVWA